MHSSYFAGLLHQIRGSLLELVHAKINRSVRLAQVVVLHWLFKLHERILLLLYVVSTVKSFYMPVSQLCSGLLLSLVFELLSHFSSLLCVCKPRRR